MTSSAPALPPITGKNKPLASLANMATVQHQLHRLSKGRATHAAVSPLRALVMQQLGDAARVRRYRRWAEQRQDRLS